jgi:asparagine synthase (glutamine-hydrolysing)
MCGICGIYKFDEDCWNGDREAIHAMNSRLIHRGPDDEGFYMSGPIALGHRRLSIIDVSSGKQPMCNEDGTIWVVFNGEIYNYRTLRNELIRKRHCFRTQSDTEVIVHLYEEVGEEIFNRLNGMFAIALWDGRAKKLILARDRLGKKPLYYHINKHRLAFASEMKALLALPDLSTKVDADSLDHYLSFFYVPSPKTISSNMAKLEAATYLVCEEGKVRKERYWSVDFGRSYSGSRKDAAAELKDLLGDAVDIRLESEVPLGAFLSGGIDSSAVVALMARSMGQAVRTTSIGFGENSYNELTYARAIAERCKTDHREHIVSPTFIEHLPRIVYHFDEPFADSSALPTYLLCQATRQHVTVALSGDGGDESFAGYERYPAALNEERWRNTLPAFWRSLALSVAQRCFSPLHRGFTTLKNLNQDLAMAGARTMFCFAEDLKKELYRPAFRRQMSGPSAIQRFLEAFPKYNGWASLSQLQACDLASYLPEDILTKVDRASMAHSLEVRSPLLDYRVVEFAASLPPEWKLNREGSKLVFREAMIAFLPPRILERQKMGFSIPVGNWFRSGWRSLGQKFLLGERFLSRGYFQPSAVNKIWDSHQKARPWLLDLGDRLWALLVLEIWHRLFMDGDTIEQVTQDLLSEVRT